MRHAARLQELLLTYLDVTDTILYLVFGSTFGSIFGFLDVAKDSVELFHNMNKDSLVRALFTGRKPSG